MFAAVLILFPGAAASEDQDKAGVSFGELRPDSKVSADMLCGLGLLMFVQEVVAQCEMPKLPIDHARERAIQRIEDFVVTNSSQHPKSSVFVEMRRAIGDGFRKSPDHRACNDPGFEKWFRGGNAAELDASVEKMLTSPFDPNQNVPCGP